LFSSITIVGVFSFIGITFINTLDNSRTFSARADWRNEAIMLANRFISDPECLGYTKLLVRYSNESGTDLLISRRVNIPLAVDRNKLFTASGEVNIDRLHNCVRLDSPEYKLFYEVTVEEEVSGLSQPKSAHNLPLTYKDNRTIVETIIPIKIIDETSISYALFTVEMAVSTEYLQAKLL